MKDKQQKQRDLDALARSMREAEAAIFVSFQKLTVDKDYALRKQLREAGLTYKVVKNTLARKAAAETPFDQVKEHFKGVTAVALTKDDPVGLSKTITKFAKENPEIFSFKVGIVEGKVVALKEVEAIANLPTKEVLISKLMFLLNCQAQRLATVISAVPQGLAVVIKQIGEQRSAASS